MFNNPSLTEEPLKPLEPRQKRFCEYYVQSLNATAAAIQAGYRPKNADNTGCKILTLPQAKAYIDKMLAQIAENTSLRSHLVSEELIKIATANMGAFFDEHGDIRNLSEIPHHLQKMVDVKTKRTRKKDGTYQTTTTYTVLNKLELMEKLTHELLNFYRQKQHSQNRW